MYFYIKVPNLSPIALLNVIAIFFILPLQNYCSEERPYILDSITCGFDYVSVPSEGLVDGATLPWIAALVIKMGTGQTTLSHMTSAVVVHPRFAVTSAARVVDMTPRELKSNSYLLIGTESKKVVKQQLETYIIHPEYYDGFKNTLALVVIRQSRDGLINAVPCLPQVYLEYDQFSSYAVELSKNQSNDVVMRKEIYNYKILKDNICKKYYEMARLSFPNIDPKYVICGNSLSDSEPCVWDTGIILIAKNLVTQKWLFLGYGIRGLGCSVPARFIDIKQYVTWIQNTMTQQHQRQSSGSIVYFTRRKKEFIWNKDTRFPDSPKPGYFNNRFRVINKTLGVCDVPMRILYYDQVSITSNLDGTSRGYYNFCKDVFQNKMLCKRQR